MIGKGSYTRQTICDYADFHVGDVVFCTTDTTARHGTIVEIVSGVAKIRLTPSHFIFRNLEDLAFAE
jgi:hypothetical protein